MPIKKQPFKYLADPRKHEMLKAGVPVKGKINIKGKIWENRASNNPLEGIIN